MKHLIIINSMQQKSKMSSMQDPLLHREPCEVCGKSKQILTCDKCASTICDRDHCRQYFDLTPRIRTYYCKPCVNKVLDKFEDYYSSDSDWEDDTNC